MPDGTHSARGSGSAPFAVVIDKYPAHNAPHIAALLRGIARRGHVVDVWTLRRGKPEAFHRVHREVPLPVYGLPTSLTAEPIRVWRATAAARIEPGFGAAFGAWLEAMWRAPSPRRLRHFGQATVLDTEGPIPPSFVLAVGLDDAAAIAQLVATLRGVRWGCMVSAADLRGLGGIERVARLRGVTLCVAESETDADAMRAVVANPDAVALAPPAVDLAHLPAPSTSLNIKDGRSKETTVQLVSVGRINDPTRFITLLNALADVPRDTNWRMVHIGDGPGIAHLRTQARALHIQRRFTWKGVCDHDEVMTTLRDSDIYLHCPGTLDALERVSHTLVEAASMRLPIVAERSSSAGGFLENKVNAVMVRPNRPVLMAEAIDKLVRDPQRRAQLGAAGRAKVEEAHNLPHLLDLIDAAVAPVEA